jgi:biotin carboxylase
MPRSTIVFIETNASGSGFEALRRAAELGYRVVFCAQRPDFFRTLPGGTDALAGTDMVLSVDTYAPQAVLRCLVEAGIEPTGILALDDYHLLVAAEVARSLRLPHHDTAGLLRCRRKDLMRITLAAAGVRQPGFTVVERSDRDLPPMNFPCVVKPVDDSGSFAVTICHDREQLVAAVQHALARAENVRGYQLTPRCLIEEFVPGAEYSVEAIWTPEGWTILGITQKVLGSPPATIEMGHAFPAVLDPQTLRICSSAALEWIALLGLDWGAAHIELRVHDGRAVPIEVNPRLAGGQITSLIKLATGLDLLEQMILMSAGCTFHTEQDFRAGPGAAAISNLISHRTGDLIAITGVERARKVPGVVDVAVIHDLPRHCSTATSNYDHIGYAIATGRDAIEAQSRADSGIAAIELHMTEDKR